MRPYRTVPRLLLAFSVGLLWSGQGAAAEAGPAASPPQWFLDNVAFMTDGSGRWIADNAAYVSEQEQWTAYGTEWVAGPGNGSMSGRLFGLRDGTESDGDFWRFSMYWNPVNGEAIVEQYGWNAIGVGTLRPVDDDGTTEMIQTFTTFAGESRDEGHLSSNPGPDTHVTESFGVAADGTREPRRTYTWRRATGGD